MGEPRSVVGLRRIRQTRREPVPAGTVGAAPRRAHRRPPLDPLALTATILGAAALTQGFFGFGFGIIAMTGLTLSHDLVHASGVVNLTGVALTASAVLQLRRTLLWRVIFRILPALLVGVTIGVTALRTLDRAVLVRLLGLTIVAIAIWNLASRRLREHDSRLADVSLGLLSGLLGGAFNTGGPPLVAHLYRRVEAPEALKATVQALFLCIGLSRLPLAAAQGLMGAAVWREAAVTAPVVVAASAAGIALARRVPAERFRDACWTALGALGLALLISG